jgi:hypothetical protein
MTMKGRNSFLTGVWLGLAVLTISVEGCKKAGVSGQVQDEALLAGRSADSLAAADEDYFHDMDRAEPLTHDEIKGRDNWIVFTGGNDRFWDYMSHNSFGALDFVKTISSHPTLGYGRHNRWDYLGTVNEPCFEEAKGPDPKRFGLWLDQRKADCPADPFENEQKYPGVKIGARGDTVPVGSYYGYATGIVGLRLFPNPDFDKEAAKHWDAKRYYEDPTYYDDKNLIRPYRVGMSCGFCHVGPSPVRPPADPEIPEWANLASNPGAQYLWTNRVLYWRGDKTNFVYQLFETYLPGTLDTSFVSTDNINNPRTMNAVYNLMARAQNSKRWKERLVGPQLLNKQFGDFERTKALADLFEKPDTVAAARVLKDGSDSVGLLGALNRVYINIGLFSEEWLLHFRPLIGGKTVTPIQIANLNKNSSYWNTNVQQTPDVALFFLKTAKPDYLKDAPGGAAILAAGASKVPRGKMVFAENCARCHSSKQPPLCEFGHECKPGQVIEDSGAYFDWLRAEVQKPDFLDGNFLSTEKRIPVTETGVNSCSPSASNGIGGNIWDNFSSQTYKELPAVGSVTVYNPVDATPMSFTLAGGGRGYTRPASLVSVWSSAPFLQNNSVGPFNPSPSVQARMASFNESIQQMLWPEKRRRDPELGDNVPGNHPTIPGPSYIQRTTETSYVKIATGYLPEALKGLLGVFDKDVIEIGPIPKGTPVGLLANLDVTPAANETHAETLERQKQLVQLIKKMIADLHQVKGKSDEEVRKIFQPLVPDLMKLSKCPDYVINKGHYFGTNLSDDDKFALIEFLKTF